MRSFKQERPQQQIPYKYQVSYTSGPQCEDSQQEDIIHPFVDLPLGSCIGRSRSDGFYSFGCKAEKLQEFAAP